MITERSPDVSPFSAIESIANWLSGTFISQPLRSRIEWRLCEGQSGALTVRKWAGRRPSILAVPPRRSLHAVVNEGLYS